MGEVGIRTHSQIQPVGGLAWPGAGQKMSQSPASLPENSLKLCLIRHRLERRSKTC
jgi:hypothetical protein